MGVKRSVSVGSAALVLSLAGATGAHAWTWASSSSPILMTGGGGFGTAVQKSYNSGELENIYLKDTAEDDGRIYVSMYADRGSSDFVVQSGRRVDGGYRYEKMSDKAFTSTYPYGVAQFTYLVRLCRDRPYQADPCSDAYRSHSGL